MLSRRPLLAAVEAVGPKPGGRILGIDTPRNGAAFDRRLSRAPDRETAFKVDRAGRRLPIKTTLEDRL